VDLVGSAGNRLISVALWSGTRSQIGVVFALPPIMTLSVSIQCPLWVPRFAVWAGRWNYFMGSELHVLETRDGSDHCRLR
jgi:hypothetical protein